MDEKITVTIEDLKAALEAYKLVLPAEIVEIFETVAQVPEFGLQVALEVQSAINAAGRKRAAQGSLFDAAIRPAFLLGLLAGREQGRKLMDSPPLCGKRIREGQPWLCTCPRSHDGECISDARIFGHRDGL